MSDDKPQRKFAKLTDQKKQELELVLLGAAMVKGQSREKVLATMPKGSMFGETGRVIDAVRELDSAPIAEWMAERGCDWSQGDDFIESITHVLLDDSSRTLASVVLNVLSQRIRHDSKEELKERVAVLAELVSKMP